MTDLNSKSLFEQTFSANYHFMKGVFPDENEAAEQALELAKKVVKGKFANEDHEFEKWSFEMLIKYKVGAVIVKPSVIRLDPVKGWYQSSMVASSFFWTRYREYLNKIKKWPIDAVQAIDSTTNEIMSSLGDPRSAVSFDKRGLVLGYVQSGKTANFTGLINKAYDVGYKLIIVLSGIHNDLRAQTQIRLDEEVIGSRTDKNGNPIGVAQIYKNTSDQIISSWTDAERDINSTFTGVRNLNYPTLMVVKKNKNVLESLRDLLIYHRDLHNLDIPVLIIDDEADQASVDTSNPDKNEDPKTINRLIRQIIEVFNRKAYVGYTATPFANLLIGMDQKTSDEGYDLYPKDFLVGLPKPEEYCGPEEFFNVYENPEDSRPSLIRVLGTEDIETFSVLKKKSDAEKFEEVPPQMREAIMMFLLVIAIRNIRGQRKKHNSMLIHTSRFKDVQSTVKDEVSRTFNTISRQIQYNSNSSIINEMKELYEKDILTTSSEWSLDIPEFTWNEVYEELRETIEFVQVFEINGNSKDALDYHQYKEEGLHVIAVGGDKLSRGLTLEGLSITYYFRNTLMYDTLMQMGRWFGYRKGYMDLCRIYTSDEIASNFEHLAIAMIELRKEFDRLAKQGKTPAEYAVKMLAHPFMTLTSPLKMRNAELSTYIYGGTLQQTRLFDTNEDFYKNNMDATANLINDLSLDRKRMGSGKTNYYVASDVSSDTVKEYLAAYKTSSNAEKVDTAKIYNYIDLANEKSELINWTVAVVEGDPGDRTKAGKYPVKLGKLELDSAVARGVKVDPVKNNADKIDIKAIVTPSHEFIDIDYSDMKNIKDRDEKRRLRSKENGLLLIYPLNPTVDVFKSLNVPFSETLVPLGIAFSFPGTEIDDKEVYQTNKTVKGE
ncbi:endonuclease [Bacillus idriensis]|uniref:Endonuclease n=1 Tax=Metabacillus idriensis TaxID=324768 RepID=A0A6I2M9B1_9BACI|nr:Z1 domain-containing protein [Metabacillus idriensis]MRX53001.1 endonuclease [Metabacillus idriensis]